MTGQEVVGEARHAGVKGRVARWLAFREKARVREEAREEVVGPNFDPRRKESSARASPMEAGITRGVTLFGGFTGR